MPLRLRFRRRVRFFRAQPRGVSTLESARSRISAGDLRRGGMSAAASRRDLRWRTVEACSTAPHGYADNPFRSRGCRLNRPTGPIHNKKSQKGLAMSEKWGISRVGKLESEEAKHCRKLLFGFKSCRYRPLPGRIASLRRFEGMGSPSSEQKPTRTRLRPSQVLPKLRTCWEESTPRLRTLTRTLKRWCFPGGGKPTVTLRVLKPTRGKNYRLRLTSSRKTSPNQNMPKMRVPSESHLFRKAAAKGVPPCGSDRRTLASIVASWGLDCREIPPLYGTLPPSTAARPCVADCQAGGRSTDGKPRPDSRKNLTEPRPRRAAAP